MAITARSSRNERVPSPSIRADGQRLPRAGAGLTALPHEGKLRSSDPWRHCRHPQWHCPCRCWGHRRAHRRHRLLWPAPRPRRSSRPRACMCCPASSTARCISASRAMRTRKTWTAAAAPPSWAGSPPCSKCPTPRRPPPPAPRSRTSWPAPKAACIATMPFMSAPRPPNIGALAELERLPGVCGIKAFLGSSTGTLLLNKPEDILAALKAGKRRVAVHSEDEDRLIARKHLAERGKPETHPVWRDAEAARTSTERVLRAGQAGRPPPACAACHHRRRDSAAGRRQGFRHRRDHAAASHPVGAGMLRAAGHLCPDEPADPRRKPSPGAVGRGARRRDRCDRLRPRAAHARGKRQDLSRHALGHARGADPGDHPSGPCQQGQSDPGAVRRPDRVRAAAHFRHRRQGPHRPRL